MTDQINKNSKHVQASSLSKKSQEKLAEIKKVHHFKTTQEAIDFMISFTKKK